MKHLIHHVTSQFTRINRAWISAFLAASLMQTAWCSTSVNTASPPSQANEVSCELSTWGEFKAYRLRNAYLDVLIVPAIGRVMRFSRPGGENWLWTNQINKNDTQNDLPARWENWGGDKTWLAPQSQWATWTGTTWPPDPAWGDREAGPFEALMLPAGGLRVTAPVSKLSGLRLIREYHLKNAEFFIKQIVENVSGVAISVSLWSDTSVPKLGKIYFVPSPNSVYPAGFSESRAGLPPLQVSYQHGLLMVTPVTVHEQKIGLDTQYVALAMQRGQELFVQRTPYRSAPYPRNKLGVESRVEYYDSGNAPKVPNPYLELELLGPLVSLARGERASQTVVWRIEALPEGFPSNDAQFTLLRNWLTTAVQVPTQARENASNLQPPRKPAAQVGITKH